jgi:hypothetical protein
MDPIKLAIKKIKGMLYCILVLAVAGGGLAFKAKHYNSLLWCTSTAPELGGLCNVSINTLTIYPDMPKELPIEKLTCATEFEGLECQEIYLYTLHK